MLELPQVRKVIFTRLLHLQLEHWEVLSTVAPTKQPWNSSQSSTVWKRLTKESEKFSPRRNSLWASDIESIRTATQEMPSSKNAPRTFHYHHKTRMRTQHSTRSQSTLNQWCWRKRRCTPTSTSSQPVHITKVAFQSTTSRQFSLFQEQADGLHISSNKDRTTNSLDQAAITLVQMLGNLYQSIKDKWPKCEEKDQS